MTPAAVDAAIHRLCDRLDRLHAIQAIALLGLVSLAANVLVGFGVVLPLVASGADLPLPRFDGLLARGAPLTLALGVLLVPLLETVLLQALPFFIARRWTGRPSAVIAVAALSHALPHGISYLGHGLTQLGGGLVLGFAYFWATRRAPKPRPILFTWAVHGCNNAVVLGALLAVTPR